MGKTRSRLKLKSLHLSPNKQNPIDFDISEDQIYDDTISKLKNGKPSEKIFGAHIVANCTSMFANESKDNLIKLIRILGPLCCDRVENTRYATIDALCQLSLLSDAMCDTMISADVMTPVIALFQKYNDCNWSDDKLSSKSFVTVFINACHLLTNLCFELENKIQVLFAIIFIISGSSAKALKIYNKSNLSDILIDAMKSYESRIEVAIASAQCLSIVIEENVVPKLLTVENIVLLKSLLTIYKESSQRLYLSNLVAYIAINLGIKLEQSVLMLIFDSIDYTLSLSCLNYLTEFSKSIEEFSDDEKQLNKLTENHSNLNDILLAKRVALEALTNMASCDDTEEEQMECDDESDDDSDNDYANDSNRMLEETDMFTIFPEIEKLLVEKSILKRAVEHLGSLNTDLHIILNKHNYGKDILNSIKSVQNCSLACIHNLVQSLPKDKLEVNSNVWNQVYCFIFGDDQQNMLIEEATNTLRAIIAKYDDIIISIEEVKKLCEVRNQNTKVVKVNIIKIMGIIAERTTDRLTIETVWQLLFNALLSESDLVIRAEIFDALIDIFSEDLKNDDVIKNLDIINKLKNEALKFKKEFHKNRHTLRHDPVISTVKLNLMRFIDYKEKYLLTLK